MEIKDLNMIDLALFARLAENEYIGMSSGLWILLPLHG